MEKLKFKLSKSELKVLVGIIGTFDFDMLTDKRNRLMIQFVIQKVFRRLVMQSITPGNKDVSFSLHPAEAVAMSAVLSLYLPPDQYSLTLKFKLLGIIDQKLL